MLDRDIDDKRSFDPVGKFGDEFASRVEQAGPPGEVLVERGACLTGRGYPDLVGVGMC